MSKTPEHLSQEGRLAFLFKDSVLYGGAAALSKAFALITLPLLVRHFTVAEYGVLDFFMVLIVFLTILFVFGQDSAVARYYYEYEDTRDRQQLISQSLAFQMAGIVGFLPVLWFAADWITGFMVDAPDRTTLFRIVLLHLPFMVLISFSQGLLKWTFERTKFLIMSVGFTAGQAGLLLIALYGYEVEVTGVLIASLINSVVFGILGLVLIKKWLVRPQNFKFLREMLPFAIPFGIICVVGALSPTLERMLTDTLLGTEQLGLYAVATKIALLIGLIVSAFQTAWGPFSLSLYKQADAAQTYNLVLKLFAIITCVGALTLTLISDFLITLLATDKYATASVVVFPLVFGLVVQATSWITEIGITLSKRSYLTIYSYTLMIIVTLSGIWLLAPIYGLLGVGLGVLAGHIVKALLASWLAQRSYKMPWQYGQIISIFVITMGVGLVAIYAEAVFSGMSSKLVLISGVLVISGTGWIFVLETEDRTTLKNILSGILQKKLNAGG
ncbi:O-antigen/teichoic acid export membrane protein [Rubricella aquisinus]|uniref:O-antigen/teichoic acid export membrane protein n=1 Tax=Rubricella aquisinus TaxID=2028108 RepID=A0A840WW97_9RHOB|nr:oligosaccharide flippase family protein [Rubricella aquisinus]MBB5514554.1 O-antigen/teichoic acid export membrane protein [Rubricella aquisinus]